MLVKAKRLGFYEHLRRREGSVFTLIDRVIEKDGKKFTLTAAQQFSDIWMEKMEQPGHAAPPPPPPPPLPDGKPLSSQTKPGPKLPVAPPPPPPPPPPPAGPAASAAAASAPVISPAQAASGANRPSDETKI